MLKLQQSWEAFLWSLAPTAEVTFNRNEFSLYKPLCNVWIVQFGSLKQLKTYLQSLEKILICLMKAAIVSNSLLMCSCRYAQVVNNIFDFVN